MITRVIKTFARAGPTFFRIPPVYREDLIIYGFNNWFGQKNKSKFKYIPTKFKKFL